LKTPPNNRRSSRRSHGDGGIDERGENTFRLRYRANGKRFAKTFHGTLGEARKELRALVRAGDTGEHVDPSSMTVEQWIKQWIEAGAPGRKRKRVGQRTLERYEELLRVHVNPKLGSRPLQKLQATEIDQLYIEVEKKIAPMTLRHVHVTFNSCLSTAERKGLLRSNPMNRIENAPGSPEGDHGIALDEAELATLVTGFRSSSPALYPIVAVTAATGVRRNEVLAFRWSDFDPVKRTIRVERALEVTKKFGVRYKPPKTWRGMRTIALDEGSVALLIKQRETHQRVLAGLPDAADVDLSLIRLPDDALIFPNPPAKGEDVSFVTPRAPHTFSKQFMKRGKKLGFPGFRFHWLRGTHATLLLDRGVPVHAVAERIGDDPAVLLRNYAKRKRKQTADTSVTSVIGALASSFLKP
jgi:integrase